MINIYNYLYLYARCAATCSKAGRGGRGRGRGRGRQRTRKITRRFDNDELVSLKASCAVRLLCYRRPSAPLPTAAFPPSARRHPPYPADCFQPPPPLPWPQQVQPCTRTPLAWRLRKRPRLPAIKRRSMPPRLLVLEPSCPAFQTTASNRCRPPPGCRAAPALAFATGFLFVFTCLPAAAAPRCRRFDPV